MNEKYTLKWNKLDDDELKKEIRNILRNLNEQSYKFLPEYYDKIENSDLKARLNNLLVSMIPDEEINISSKIVDIGVRLNLPVVKHSLLKLIEENPIIKDEHSNFILNWAIGELKLQEATKFLTNQIDSLFDNSEAKQLGYEEYVAKHLTINSALFALGKFSPELKKEYMFKIKGDTFQRWKTLNKASLRTELKRVIAGTGMSASTQFSKFVPEYYTLITDNELKKRINDILMELMGDINGIGDRVIYICMELQLSSAKDIILHIINNSDHLFKAIKKAIKQEQWDPYIAYIRALNIYIDKFHMKEANNFLVNQISFIKGTTPKPAVTKEYYFYSFCAQLAMEVLKKIDPGKTRGQPMTLDIGK